jgi:SARP family transcriptional regulator, regulator of embCAB operon
MIERPASGDLTFSIFGDFAVVGPLGRFAPGRSRPGALLAILLVNAGRTVSVDRLLEELWPQDALPANPKRLHVNVTRLRQSLSRVAPCSDPAALICTRPGGYAAQIDPRCIDACCFEQLVRRGRMALESADAPRAAADLRGALGLWRGAPYAGYEYEPWAGHEVRRLEELRLGAIEDWAQAELEVGAHARIASELEQVVQRHPLRERLRALLMLALYRCRRQGEALACYRAARRALVEELGIEPGRELRQLECAILEQSPSLEWAGSRARLPVALEALPIAC